MCDRFAAGAKDAGNVVEKIFLKDHRINYCTGCGVCNNTHKCVQKDDMEPLIQKMIDADVIVGAKTKDLVILEKELSEVAGNLYVTTDDGSYGRSGQHGRIDADCIRVRMRL